MKAKTAMLVGLVLSMAGIADTAPDSNSIIKDNIEYYIHTDKSVYDLGEEVEILYRVTNLTDVSVNLGTLLPDPPDNYDLRIMQGNAQVWWYPYTAITAVIRDFILQPLETKEFQTTWDMMNDNGTPFQEYDDFFVTPGSYNVVGEVALSFGYERVPVSVSIEIIPEPPKTYYVNAADGSDNNDGLSPQTAFATIQKAIDTASNGDTVIVADGTYTGPGNRDIDFLGKAITVRSESGPENCIIDCQNSGYGFLLHSTEDENSILDGFTITNSYDGIHCQDSSPTINNCTIGSNTGEWGSGIYCAFSSPVITNCTISGNIGQIPPGRGGGIFCWESNPTIFNCIITGNKGGIACYDSSATITNCTFSKNSDEAIYCGLSSLTIINCILWGNTRGIVDYGASISVTYTDIQGGWEGEGNIDADPLLTLDGHLQAGSPCIDVGDPNADFTSQVDIDGEPRIMGTRVDMGSDEFFDADTDGLPDWWESKYFDSATAAEPNADTDFDGYTNLTEYNIYSSNPTVAAKTCYVDANQPDDSGDGLSWETAKRTIQAAIDTTTNSGDRVIIALGIYTGLGNYDLNPSGRMIVIQSTDPDDPDVVASTIIDPNREGHGFYFDSGETDRCTVSGLTITNGRYGILCEFSSPTITNCTLEGNGWGAIFCYESSPMINNCIITGNEGPGSYGSCYFDGAIRCEENSSPTIINCTITENRGGIHCHYDSSPIITNCTISDTLEGIYCGVGSSPTITNSTISGNDCGGIHCYGANLIINNCLINGNLFPHGGGIRCAGSNLTITNCTIAGNWGGGIWSRQSSLTITNCIFWDNYAVDDGNEIYLERSSNASVSYTDVQGDQNDVYIDQNCTLNWGPGNINFDPCFVDPGYRDTNYIWVDGDYHLLPDSPCIDAGDNISVPADIHDLDGDGNTAEPLPFDLDGNPRFVDRPDIEDTGNGTPPIVDMGAYEAMVSCFGVNHVKLGTKAGKKGNKVEVKGTFDPASPIDFAVDDVTYTIDDGLGYMLTFIIPAGSFEPEGKPHKQKFRFHSAKGSQPGIKAKFDFLKCKFELKVKGLMDTSEITADTLAIVLQAGANIAQEIVELEVKGKKGEHLEYKRKPKLNCCPEM